MQVESPVAIACRQRAETLRARLSEDYAILAEPPFVLIGDLSPVDLARWRREEIVPTAAAMRDIYGLPAPDAPITIALLSNDARYRQAAFDLHGEAPPTRFGYYRPARRTLVVNLSHAVGPLRHELTHALTAGLPIRLPLWLDEGLASMHEECIISIGRQGRCIEPQDNWRLDTLRRALADGRLPPLAELIERSEELVSRDRALFFAQARCFCIFLHERGRLKECLLGANNGGCSIEANSVARDCGFKDAATLDAAFRCWLHERLRKP